MPCADADNDGACDAIDNCLGLPNPSQADGDDDGLGDDCDPCTNGAAVTKGRLILGKVTPPPGDDKLKFKGEMTVPTSPPLDLWTYGARVLIEDTNGAAVLDVTIPGGPYNPSTGVGWTVSGSGWKYRNRSGLQGITGMTVRHSTAAPDHLKFGVKGKNGTWPVAPTQLPLAGTFVVEGPIGRHGQCGVASFPGLPGPRCTLAGGGRTVLCK